MQKGSSIIHQPLVFVDIETTGGTPRGSRVLEVAAIRVEENQVVRRYQTLLDPGGLVPANITHLTGITNSDIEGAPTFEAVADDLAEILDGAIFVAHNVHFDHGFLKMEFDRLGVPFSPKLLCTVRLSRSLYPQYRRHSLQAIIDRFGFEMDSRHRAMADTEALWMLYRRMLSEFDLDTIEAAASGQLKAQSIPKHLDKSLVDALPNTPGVYIFEDQSGQPLYIGKSVKIRSRVMSHFAGYHSSGTELRISERIHHIRTIPTCGELGALLTESDLVKELVPLHNRQLRKRQRVTIATRYVDEAGYYRLKVADASTIDPRQAGDIMAVYQTAGRAKASLYTAARNFILCAQVMNLDKGRGYCFQYQLKKCRGACAGEESASEYNARFLAAFERMRLHAWPYAGPILITERNQQTGESEAFVVDQWCLLSRLRDDGTGGQTVVTQAYDFDMDMYKILRRYIAEPANRHRIRVLSPEAMEQLISIS